MVELARLESVYRRNPIKGSNPFPSASTETMCLRLKSGGIFHFRELANLLAQADGNEK